MESNFIFHFAVLVFFHRQELLRLVTLQKKGGENFTQLLCLHFCAVYPSTFFCSCVTIFIRDFSFFLVIFVIVLVYLVIYQFICHFALNMEEKSASKRQSGKRPVKRKFTGNIHTRKNSSGVRSSSDLDCSTSGKKLKVSSEQMNDSHVDKNFEGYRLFDKAILFTELQNSLSCKSCGSEIEMKEEVISGLSIRVTIHCKKCGQISAFRNSKMLESKCNVPEINRRYTYSMRCLGQGLSGMRTFCTMMDMPPPVSQAAYSSHMKRLNVEISKVALESMKKAAKEESYASNESGNIIVSGDGSWKTRGHSSLTGVCTVIGELTCKVIDVEVMSSFCKACDVNKSVLFGTEREKWQVLHEAECQKNHSGSAGSMEVIGMKKIFHRSQETRDVRYTSYIGDGDSKTFPAVIASKPYGEDVVIAKIECVGHIQKRMGTKLRKLKSSMAGQKLEDGKTLGGKGRLTDKLIDKLTVYYGNAIRQHKDSLDDMRKAVWAVFFHTGATDEQPTHNFCPKGESSWCKYNREVAVGKTKAFCHKTVMPKVIMDKIKPIFNELSHPTLLKRCLGGHTQNTNESLNSLIWKFCPKRSSSGKRVIETAVHKAAVIYNEGNLGHLFMLEAIGVTPGKYAYIGVKQADKVRLSKAEYRTKECSKERRQAKRQTRLHAAEAAKRIEGPMYSAGQF